MILANTILEEEGGDYVFLLRPKERKADCLLGLSDNMGLCNGALISDFVDDGGSLRMITLEDFTKDMKEYRMQGKISLYIYTQILIDIDR